MIILDKTEKNGYNYGITVVGTLQSGIISRSLILAFYGEVPVASGEKGCMHMVYALILAVEIYGVFALAYISLWTDWKEKLFFISNNERCERGEWNIDVEEETKRRVEQLLPFHSRYEGLCVMHFGLVAHGAGTLIAILYTCRLTIYTYLITLVLGIAVYIIGITMARSGKCADYDNEYRKMWHTIHRYLVNAKGGEVAEEYDYDD